MSSGYRVLAGLLGRRRDSSLICDPAEGRQMVMLNAAKLPGVYLNANAGIVYYAQNDSHGQ